MIGATIVPPLRGPVTPPALRFLRHAANGSLSLAIILPHLPGRRTRNLHYALFGSVTIIGAAAARAIIRVSGTTGVVTCAKRNCRFHGFSGLFVPPLPPPPPLSTIIVEPFGHGVLSW